MLETERTAAPVTARFDAAVIKDTFPHRRVTVPMVSSIQRAS